MPASSAVGGGERRPSTCLPVRSTNCSRRPRDNDLGLGSLSRRNVAERCTAADGPRDGRSCGLRRLLPRQPATELVLSRGQFRILKRRVAVQNNQCLLEYRPTWELHSC